jgi:meso-butanediol dehydrogenase / (S,S)-butanediol dehydrogenase / diacetyl reductase
VNKLAQGETMSLLEKKVVLITGAASGIGRECALAYAREGALVMLLDIDGEKARQTVQEIGKNCASCSCDVSNAEAVERAVGETLARFGRIDAVHNNAGIASPSLPLDQTSEREWDSLMGVNLKSIYWMTRSTLPELKKTRGTILNTASMVGLIGQANHAAYSATKGAIISLTKSMALDYAPFGIRVNAICPAAVWTPLLEQWCSEQPDPKTIRGYLDNIHALGYCPHGDVVADAAVFLLSERARFITGCILPVSGGAELGYRR